MARFTRGRDSCGRGEERAEGAHIKQGAGSGKRPVLSKQNARPGRFAYSAEPQGALTKLISLAAIVLFLSCFGACKCAYGQGKEYAGFSGKGDIDKFNKATELTNNGVVLLNAKKTDDAIAKFKAAIEIYPDQTKAHENLGIAYRQKKQLDLAETECKKAVELEKGNWKAWRNLGTVYFDEKKYDDAITAYQSSLAAKPPAAKAASIKADLQYVMDLKKRSAK